MSEVSAAFGALQATGATTASFGFTARRDTPGLPSAGYDFALKISELQHGVILTVVEGELDRITADHFADPVLASLREALAPQLVVDLSGLRFLDEVGIHALLRAHKLAVRRDGRLWLLGTRGAVLKTLKARGLSTVFPFVSSLAEVDTDLGSATPVGR